MGTRRPTDDEEVAHRRRMLSLLQKLQMDRFVAVHYHHYCFIIIIITDFIDIIDMNIYVLQSTHRDSDRNTPAHLFAAYLTLLLNCALTAKDYLNNLLLLLLLLY